MEEKQTVEAEQAYKKQRNLVRKESRRLERKQQCEVAETCKTKPKKFWKYVRSKRENRGGIGDIKAKDEEGNEVTVTEDKENAKMFARYFSAVLPERDYVTFGSLLSQFRLSSVCLSVVCRLSVCNVGAPY